MSLAMLKFRAAGALLSKAFRPGVRAVSASAPSWDADSACVGRLNHVAIAVPNLSEAAARYKSVLGSKVSEPQALPEHGVTVVFVELANTKLELLEPLGEKSPIAGFLAKNPAGGMHHICLEVDDVKESMGAIKDKVRLLGEEPKIGAHGNPVIFMHPKDMAGVLTELEEVKGST